MTDDQEKANNALLQLLEEAHELFYEGNILRESPNLFEVIEVRVEKTARAGRIIPRVTVVFERTKVASA